MRKHARSRVPPVASATYGAMDLVSDADVRERTSRPVAHPDRRVAREAIRTRVEASTVRVDAPAEADVGAVVVREDLARVVLVHFEPRGRGLFEVLDLGGGPRVGRGGDRLQHAWIYCTEHAFRSIAAGVAMSFGRPRRRRRTAARSRKPSRTT